MSKGPGVIQRAISGLFAADPEGVFTTEDLCREVYASRQPSKKERVAILRAAKALMHRYPGMVCQKAETQGGTCIFFHHDNLVSYAIARLRSDRLIKCPSNAQARLDLQKERCRKLMAHGGSWWLLVQDWIAKRDHDTARLQELKPYHDARIKALEELLASKRPSS
jgi:hypothetical protein